MIRGLLLVALGVAGLSAFCWFIWPPLTLLPVSAALVASGLFIDWEAQRGKSAPSHRPPK